MKAVWFAFLNMNVLPALYVLNAQQANMVGPFLFILMNQTILDFGFWILDCEEI